MMAERHASLPAPDRSGIAYKISLDVLLARINEEHLPVPPGIVISTEEPTRAMLKMRVLQTAFSQLYRARFVECEPVPLDRQQAYPYFSGVLNQLFADGINWGRIVGMFFFAAEFARQHVVAGQSDVVRDIVDWTASYADQEVADWVDEKGGWEASYADPPQRFPECDCRVM